MIRSMLGNASYCKRNPKRKCYDAVGGKKICGCAGGWSVFFATMRKRGWDEKKARPKKVTEAVFMEAVEQTVEEMDLKLIKWFESTLKASDVNVPRWVGLAKRVISNPKLNEKMKKYWRGRLEVWCKKNPTAKVCKGIGGK